VLAECVSVSHARKGAKKIRVANSLRAVSTAADTAASTAFFEVRAVSFLLCRLRLRTSLKPSSWEAADFVVLDWPAGVFAFNTAFNSCTATVYVQYTALNRVFPVRALQKFCLFSAALLTMDDHCSLSPTEAGVYLAISSTSQITLSSFFSCASASGNCPISCWYSDFYFLHVSIPNA
jgi:hypothetical protein